MELFEKLKKVADNQPIKYVMKNFAKTSMKHPHLTINECSRFMARWLNGTTEKPKEGLRLEQHCHSHFSDGDELSDVIDELFKKDIEICSLTDHDNFKAFDSLKDGSYDLEKLSTSGSKYELDFSSDNRSMIIHSKGKHVVLFRSIELLTDKGELGIHCYPNNNLYAKMPMEDAIDESVSSGAYVIINHPYHWFGIGINGRKCIELAVKKGAIAFEKNGTEIPFQIHSAIRAEIDAKHFGISLVTSGDAHRLFMYGLSGLTFAEKDYEDAFLLNSEYHADAAKHLIKTGKFETYFNYLTPEEVYGFLYGISRKALSPKQSIIKTFKRQ